MIIALVFLFSVIGSTLMYKKVIEWERDDRMRKAVELLERSLNK